MGKWKLEHELKQVTIWGPKFYRFITCKDEIHQHLKGVNRANLNEDLWRKLRDTGEVSVVNKNVFTKKFGAVWVDD